MKNVITLSATQFNSYYSGVSDAVLVKHMAFPNLKYWLSHSFSR